MSLLDEQKEAKRLLIIEAAARVFAQKGYAGAVVSDIAVQAGIGKGTIYEYFESKEELFFAVYEWFTQKTGMAATVSISSLSGSTTERLAALNDALMGMWDEIEEMFTLMMEFWAASSLPNMRSRFKKSFRQMYQEFREIVSSLIRDGIKRGEFRSDANPDSVAAALVGTWDALFLQAWFEEEFDVLGTARDFLDVVLKGLLVGQGPNN